MLRVFGRLLLCRVFSFISNQKGIPMIWKGGWVFCLGFPVLFFTTPLAHINIADCKAVNNNRVKRGFLLFLFDDVEATFFLCRRVLASKDLRLDCKFYKTDRLVKLALRKVCHSLVNEFFKKGRALRGIKRIFSFLARFGHTVFIFIWETRA